ncbi:hypothetical protein [Dyella flagellata]|uniref:Uncharacterized protein n=1 Tax=Dyella flagellata TaxID=1867833 RepID=A0ABQ5X7X3_9GAMM|nr:hypothetical protein [Dyella flagellata]GLQ87716.1 hypothetical protein GCM10007898_12830 [Dyella flagellata]
MLSSLNKDFLTATPQELTNRPPFRRLRGYAFDPSLSLQLDTAAINHAIIEVPWESNLKPGPRGEYVEVVDYDPASGAWYEPVNLNSTELLAQDGVSPSEGNPEKRYQVDLIVLGRAPMVSTEDLAPRIPHVLNHGCPNLHR